MEDIKCTGCGTCMYACPTNAISMEKNSEGFIYPKVSREKCILCGRCLNTCPSLKAYPEEKPLYSKCVVSNEDGQKNS
ncbi:4Fe-4S dicluster domain-containing protein, partial [Salmonella enterica]|uniref:4Fe-4S dicluster domain-containing protein n=1 Tax=Salmonella enterica TaxID=28901 RepID=UPI0020C43186